MVEIDAYFSVENVQSKLKWVIDAATNSTNVDKVKAIQAELETRVVKDDVFAPVSLPWLLRASQSWMARPALFRHCLSIQTVPTSLAMCLLSLLFVGCLELNLLV